MSKFNFKQTINSIHTQLVKHSPEILTGLGIAGMVTTTILAVKATPKALRDIEAEKERQNRIITKEAMDHGQESCNQIDKLKITDTVKVTWKSYLPSAIIGTTSIACLIGACSVHARRNAVLATAYKLSETALTEYKEKVIETIGEKKERAIRDKIDKDHIDKDPVSKKDVIITGKGETLCYDDDSGRYFYSDIDKINKAINELNRQILLHQYMSLNEFYDLLGLTGTKTGVRVGWNIDSGAIEADFSTQISDDGRPCIVLNYNTPPKYNFDRFF